LRQGHTTSCDSPPPINNVEIGCTSVLNKVNISKIKEIGNYYRLLCYTKQYLLGSSVEVLEVLEVQKKSREVQVQEVQEVQVQEVLEVQEVLQEVKD
jgi:hypothetical protein